MIIIDVVIVTCRGRGRGDAWEVVRMMQESFCWLDLGAGCDVGIFVFFNS